jgi:uncharacterized RDD family membrane protein YckC/predicted RNA-binding Zn-ribbon protein involved in translation (DUF1610 family)
MPLVTCSECQSQVSDRAVSCPHCGNVFTRCPECGNEVKSGESACKNCGYPLGRAPAAPQAQYASQLLRANTEDFVPDSGAVVVVYAGFWRRFVAALIDGVLVTVVLFVLDILLALVLKSSPPALAAAISLGLTIGVGIAYYVVQESSSQQATLGKRALGIIVTDIHGHRISNARALGRYFAKLLSAFTLLIGYIMAGFTEKKQALHDMMAGTLVVVKPPSR